MARSKRIPHCRLMLVEHIKPGMMISSGRFGKDRYVNLNAPAHFQEVYSANPNKLGEHDGIALRVSSGVGAGRIRRHKTGTRLLVRIGTRVTRR